MTDDTQPASPLTSLAAEVADFWQEQLAAAAADPAAKAEMMKLMEPSRQMFAEWMKKAQNNPHATGSFRDGFAAAPFTVDPASATDAAPGATAARPASDDYALRLAQLAHRVAELEKRIAKLESRPRGTARRAAGAAGED